MKVIITETTRDMKDGVPVGEAHERVTIWDKPETEVPMIVTGWDGSHPDPEKARKGLRERTRVTIEIEGWVES